MFIKINKLAILTLICAAPLSFAQTHCVRSGSPGHITINCHGTLTPQQAWRLSHGMIKMDRRIFRGVWKANHNIMNHAMKGCWLGIAGRWHCPNA